MKSQIARSENIRVLLIEDNPSDACVIEEMLAKAKSASFDLERAGLLSTGLGRLASGGIDLVILDFSLPDSEGIDTLRKVCAQAPQVPVLVMTTFADEVTAIEAVREGALDYFIKGQVERSRLVKSILFAIERKQVEQKLQEAYDEAMQHEVARHTRVEARLRESEEKFRTLFATANDATLLVNHDQDIIFDCNPNALKIFGCTPEQIIGQSPGLFFPEVQPDGKKSTEAAREKMNAAVEGQPQFFEWKHRRYDGTLFDAEVSLNAYSTKGKKYIQAIVRNITERKRAESQLNEQLTELQRWQNVTLGRETRILDLKREVNELLGKTGEPPRYPSAESQDEKEE